MELKILPNFKVLNSIDLAIEMNDYYISLLFSLEQVFIIYGTHVLLENLYFIRLFDLAVFKMIK